METKLARISQLSKENPDMVFTSLGHLINKEMLENCHVQMDGTKAVGIWSYQRRIRKKSGRKSRSPYRKFEEEIL